MPMHTEAERRKNKKKQQEKSFAQHITDIYEAARRIMPGGIGPLTKERHKGQTQSTQGALDKANEVLRKRKKGQ